MTNDYNYSHIASEYYNSGYHPTCANFRQLGIKGLAETFSSIMRWGSIQNLEILETGAGKSTVAEFFSEKRIPSRRLTIQDKYQEMLHHSHRWQNELANMMISDARYLGVPDSSYDCVFSFLLDPYDTDDLWREIFRVLRPNSRWVLTSPSKGWASQFRNAEKEDFSTFIDVKGRQLDLPSYTYSPDVRIKNLHEKGFRLEFFKEFLVEDIDGEVSRKLITNETKNPVLDYFVFYKP